MKKIYNRKLRLSITLKLWQGDELILSTTKRVKSRLFQDIEHSTFSKGYLKVNYYPGVFNDGYYTTKADLKHQLTTFTEKSLIEFIESHEWPTI